MLGSVHFQYHFFVLSVILLISGDAKSNPHGTEVSKPPSPMTGLDHLTGPMPESTLLYTSPLSDKEADTGASHMDMLCQTEVPINFIWLGSTLKPEHESNIQKWAENGHPVIVWYIPNALDSIADEQSFKDLETIHHLQSSSYPVLALDITKAGLDELYTYSSSSSPITKTASFLACIAKTHSLHRPLFAMASNLLRLALLVKGPDAIINAINARNNEDDDPLKNDIPAPDYPTKAMLYMDTDIYLETAGQIVFPHQKHNFAVHIFRDIDGNTRMNNDILFTGKPSHPFFAHCLKVVMDKFTSATHQKNNKEYMDANPPEFNGAYFMFDQLTQYTPDCNKLPAIQMTVEPLKTEGNWHRKGYKPRFPLVIASEFTEES